MRLDKLFLLSIFLIVSQGCAYKAIKHGEEITQEEASSKLIRGETTKNEVFLNFGEPTKIANSESVFFCSWTRGSKVAVAGIGSGSAEGSSLVVIFDSNDVVQDYRISRGAVDSGQID